MNCPVSVADEKPSHWLTWGTVGDVAHILLCATYNRNWPTSEFEQTHELRWDESYSSYHRKFLRNQSIQQNRENRRKLQQAWEQVVEQKKQ
ncbi:MAG: hypothetical protein ACYS21_20065 [Planctomycetota bacterium]|jgi:hypothetical protein